MQAYLIHKVTRFRKDLVVDGNFLSTFKIGSKLKFQDYEFLVKGVLVGERTPVIKNKDYHSILLEPIQKIEDEQSLINQILEIVI